MKNIFKFKTILRIVGIIALVAVIGFSMVSCDDSNGDKGNGGGGGLEGNGVVWQSTFLTSTGLVFKDGIVYGAVSSGDSWTAINKGTYTNTTIVFNGNTGTYTISGNTLTISDSSDGKYTKKTGQKINFY